MSKLLTIAIPTFNRASKLDRQLAWLGGDLAGFEDRCEVILSDNASTDATADVCERWRGQIESRGASCLINRNPENIGPLPNISRCIELARSQFVWVVGDDDEIPAGTLAWVIQTLEAHPQLASIVMNFAGVGRTVYPRCFTFDRDQLGDGKVVLEKCLRQAYFGLAFMTAQVYRTEFVQSALKFWPDGKTNYDYQVFLTAFAGLHGQVLATRDTHVKYVTGDNVYEKNPRVAMALFADSLEVFIQLRRAGYSAALCRSLGRKHVWGYKKRFVKNALRAGLAVTIRTMARASMNLARLSLVRRGSEFPIDAASFSRTEVH